MSFQKSWQIQTTPDPHICEFNAKNVIWFGIRIPSWVNLAHDDTWNPGLIPLPFIRERKALHLFLAWEPLSGNTSSKKHRNQIPFPKGQNLSIPNISQNHSVCEGVTGNRQKPSYCQDKQHPLLFPHPPS